ncbi:Malto-oligosyltrehalose trehalohydrolase [Legionella wadsworthii]|uniref:Malto-oligosyltrehalose trehalohydrolase n=1 Tax=Legionella wadsworthii TaxID=28088 RepID=A0A378LS72_9GAMM|nr:malto-oligosyltrehalose trehalohydrolase [Legionella wadsworthii]STY29633.1 Malto-oligosyltrehalose trehalohydrolase [Legionella wadsworthii]
MYVKRRTLGAHLKTNGQCEFKIWAPFLKELMVEIIPKDNKPYRLPMNKDEEGYFLLVAEGIHPKDRYYYCSGSERLPDLAADYLPEGINGPAEILLKQNGCVWKGRTLESYIIYELHVGTYTPEGTFSAIIPHLSELKELGITALEIMPVAQFSGNRNWGYDGVFPFAVQNTYGGPEELKKLVHACHQLNIAVILDVVYNHIGPEGNYFEKFGPYFTDKYKTPWGKSLNFDDAYSHQVRNYFIENALHWFIEYGIDALRLDALHAIVDNSAYPFLEELADEVAALSKEQNYLYYLIAESSANDTRLVRDKEQYGFGIHAQWNDEFHHALHSLITKERHGYYEDFGEIQLFVKAYQEGFAYSGEYSRFRKRPHGMSSANIPADRFIVFMQNHDHIGNRPMGDRLTQTLSPMQIKFYASLLFFSPYIPLIFMGEEYGDTAPFQYFISHSDPDLIRAVREGRKKEFSFMHHEAIPDPQSEQTFINSKLNHALKNQQKYKGIWQFYKRLIELRTTKPALYTLSKENMELKLIDSKLLFITREMNHHSLCLVANFSLHEEDYSSHLNTHTWKLIINSSESEPSNNKIPSFGILIFEKGNPSE